MLIYYLRTKQSSSENELASDTAVRNHPAPYNTSTSYYHVVIKEADFRVSFHTGLDEKTEI